MNFNLCVAIFWFQVPLVESKLKYLKIPPATLIVQATESDTPLLFVVVGCLSAWIKQPDDDSGEITMEAFTIGKGEMFSGLAVLSGEPMLFLVESKVTTKVIAIPRSASWCLNHNFAEKILSFKIWHEPKVRGTS